MVQQKDAAAIYRHANMLQHAILLAEQPGHTHTHSAQSMRTFCSTFHVPASCRLLDNRPETNETTEEFLTLCLDAYVMMPPGRCASMVSAPLHYDIKASSDTVQSSTNVQRRDGLKSMMSGQAERQAVL